MKTSIEQLDRMSQVPTDNDGLADHCTIDRKFLSELCTLAKRGLATMPRPISGAVIGERYIFFTNGKFRTVDIWCSLWKENHHNWPEPFTHCTLLSALELP